MSATLTERERGVVDDARGCIMAHRKVPLPALYVTLIGGLLAIVDRLTSAKPEPPPMVEARAAGTRTHPL